MNAPFLIGITGGSGSGKSTFIQHLRERFTEQELCIISMDEYYLPRDQQREDEKGEKILLRKGWDAAQEEYKRLKKLYDNKSFFYSVEHMA
jgi:uridine kinase